jgi:Putative Actinobacterial Holin-X, holin superfamily III
MNHQDGNLHDGHLREEPVGKLVHDFVEESKRVLSEGKKLLRTEVESAKAELRTEVKKLGPAAAMAGGGGVVLHAAVLMFAVAVGALLAEAMPAWVAFLLTSIAFGIVGGVLLSVARKRVATIDIKPTQTIHRLEEDQRWARELTQSNRSNLQQNT